MVAVGVMGGVVASVWPDSRPTGKTGYQTATGQLAGQATVIEDAAAAGGQAVQFQAPVPSSAGFTHPGVLVDKSQLDFVKHQVAAGAEPWKGAITKARNSRFGNPAFTPRPVVTIDCTANAAGCDYEHDDAIAAYTQALLWYYTGDRAHAQASVRILNAWATTMLYSNGDQAHLNHAWSGESFSRAAEMMRYTYTPAAGETPLNVAAVTSMFNNVILPQIAPDTKWAVYSAGNWDLSMADASIGIAVFTDNRALFDSTIERWKKRITNYIYLTSDGPNPIPVEGNQYNDTPAELKCGWANLGQTGNCSIPAGWAYNNGQVAETCRDISHVTMGLEAMTYVAETARLQGVDLYGQYQERITAGYEFSAKYNAMYLDGQTIPAAVCGGVLRPGGTGYTLGWEVAYNHYANRLGQSLPFTQALVSRFRPTGAVLHMDYETLTHAGNALPPGCSQPDPRYGTVAINVEVPADGTYRLWTRVRPAEGEASAWALQVDGGCAMNFTSTGSVAGAWTWLDYRDGNPAAKVDLQLTAGQHTLLVTGQTAGLAIDNLSLKDDLTCTPMNADGDCPAPTPSPTPTPDPTPDPTPTPSESPTPSPSPDPTPDTTAPTVTLTAPTSGGTVTLACDLTAEAADDTGVTQVEFLVNGEVAGVSTQAPYRVVWDVSGLPNGVYTVQSRARDAAGNTTTTEPVSVTVDNPDLTSPTSPQDLVASNVQAHSVALSWSVASDDRGVTGYRVYRGTTLVGTVTDTSFTDTGLIDATAYTYSVHAFDAAGNVSASSPEVVVTTPDATAPTSPTGLTANAGSETTISLSWTAATDNLGVTGYRISRNGTEVGQTTTTSFTDNGLLAGQTYSYTVLAEDAAGNRSAATPPAEATTLDITKPSAPTGLTATAPTETTVNLSWVAATDNVGVTGYRVFRGTTQIATISNLTYTDTGRTVNTTYTYTVVAVDAAANVSSASNSASVTTPDKTAPSTPGSLTATVTAYGQVALNWSAASDNLGVTSYRLVRGTTQLMQANVLTYTNTGLAPGTSYTYSVVALDAAGNVSAARTTTITTPTDLAPYGTGWSGAYFANTALTGPTIGRLDPAVDFSWGTAAPMPGIPADNYSVRWTGQLKPTTTGSYTFYTTGDDGIRVWLNDTLIIDKWNSNTAGTSSARALVANTLYNLRVEYQEKTGNATAKLQWSGPSIAKATLPASVMTSGSAGLTASYFSNATLANYPALVKLDNLVNNTWSGAPISPIPADNFSVRWTGKVKPVLTGTHTFYTDSDDGVRLWVNGQLLINNWTDHGVTTNQATISLTAGTWYDIKMEYYDRTNSATAKLSWSYTGLVKTIIPSSALRDR
jgi:chitodextrinase